MNNEKRIFYKRGGFIVLLVIFGISFAISAWMWMAHVKERNAVKEDLMTYVNETLPKFSDKEREIVELHESMTVETMYFTISSEIMPKYRVFIEELESTEIETEELTKIHEIYIKSANHRYGAYSNIITAMEEQDLGKMDEANAKFPEARAMNRDYQTKLKALAKDHDVVVDNNLFYNLRDK